MTRSLRNGRNFGVRLEDFKVGVGKIMETRFVNGLEFFEARLVFFFFGVESTKAIDPKLIFARVHSGRKFHRRDRGKILCQVSEIMLEFLSKILSSLAQNYDTSSHVVESFAISLRCSVLQMWPTI